MRRSGGLMMNPDRNLDIYSKLSVAVGCELRPDIQFFVLALIRLVGPP